MNKFIKDKSLYYITQKRNTNTQVNGNITSNRGNAVTKKLRIHQNQENIISFFDIRSILRALS